MTGRRAGDPENWHVTHWLKLAGLALGVGAALFAALAWAQARILEPEVTQRKQADDRLEARVVAVADSVRHIYDVVDTKLDRVLDRLESNRRQSYSR